MRLTQKFDPKILTVKRNYLDYKYHSQHCWK